MTAAVFDTDIVVDALRGVAGAHGELLRYANRYISRLTWLEVMALAMPDDAGRAESYLEHFRVIELNEDIARQASVLRSQRRRIKAIDAIVLASAQSTGRILVTRNITDFPAEMPGIRIPYTLKD
ncbi:PIN domain-containing protein [Altererythrobacter aerius]|uniref:PIN domain-containing protein n=1 Tax=Tsuneonella aeria TaxID=1837929 RepID=A0A6I4TBM3_9SPHN|nr:PIN domain-containing protein [Tsuneonella aeria]